MADSEYPDSLDVLTTLVDGFDNATADWFNRLFQGTWNIENVLATNPSDPNRGSGSAWNGGAKYTDVKTLVQKLGAIEVGKFEISFPTESPASINFVDASKFSDKTKLFIQCVMLAKGKGFSIPQFRQHRINILETAGSPTGFEFYLRGMNSSSSENWPDVTWLYFAYEEKL